MQRREPAVPPLTGEAAEREMRRRSRRGFLVAMAAAGAGMGGWRWLATRPETDGAVAPVRRILEFNEKVAGRIFDPERRIVELPATALSRGGPRLNGLIGLETAISETDWRLRIAGTAIAVTLAEIMKLPATTQITPLHCIEGWTTVAKWTGVKFADFAKAVYPEGGAARYVGMATPAGEYFVGLDAPSAFHPQTLLCYAINDAPLSQEHGAPLRLLIPTKYGVKNLKRIGTIGFSDLRPGDYWAQKGYDWFAGL